MPRKKAYAAEIEYLQILDEHGQFDEELGRGVMDDSQAVHLYEQMSICRAFDDVAFKLQRSGRMGTYPQNRGQEAASGAVGLAMRPGHDWLMTSYRENLAITMMGVPYHLILLHWMGDERGNHFPEGVKVTPMSVPIGTHMLHAVGAAWAIKLRGEKNAASFTFFGDGATSEGDFHGAMNFASTLKVPTVFVCQNNQWAISVPYREQTNSRTVAQKALAYDMPTIQVDGNDIFAVHRAAKEARARAIAGEGPSFIEAITYRLGDHTTADDARRYRPEEELEAWTRRDPLIRTRLYLEKRGLWNAERQTEIEQRGHRMVIEAVRTAEGVESPTPADMFDFLFETLPDDVAEQRDRLRTTSLGRSPQQGLRSGGYGSLIGR